MNFLLIEDADIYIKIIKKALSDNLNYTLDISTTIKEGMEKINSKNYQIILVNVKMEDSTGDKIVSYIRNELKDKATYIIGLSSETNLEYIERMYKYGIDYYISKPFDPILLNLLIDRILERIDQFTCVYKEEK